MDLLDAPVIVLRLLIAALFGMVLGLDRQLRGKPAGLRTHMLIALGAAAMTMATLEIYRTLVAAYPNTRADPLRAVQGVTMAIGFIGGGVLIGAGRMRHLTTAANIWLCGAIGLTCGAGDYLLAFLIFVFTAAILSGIGFVERRWLPKGEE
jgi:putative Mg2+ transporter-C (MgtC) family protein